MRHMLNKLIVKIYEKRVIIFMVHRAKLCVIEMLTDFIFKNSIKIKTEKLPQQKMG